MSNDPHTARPGSETDLDLYLRPGRFVDSNHPAVIAYAKQKTGHLDGSDKAAMASALFYAVRDGIRYNPYSFTPDPEALKASSVLAAAETFCIPKAILLAAGARAVGIPARLGFADVLNHLASERLRRLMKTDVFAFHGYTELFIRGQWVKATPAFNASLCDKFRIRPLEFNGLEDALFHPFDLEGRKHMEYVHQYGTFADLPYEEMMESFRTHYPGLLEKGPRPMEGDIEAEGPGITHGTHG